jgi:hypothetical protein
MNNGHEIDIIGLRECKYAIQYSIPPWVRKLIKWRYGFEIPPSYTLFMTLNIYKDAPVKTGDVVVDDVDRQFVVTNILSQPFEADRLCIVSIGKTFNKQPLDVGNSLYVIANAHREG